MKDVLTPARGAILTALLVGASLTADAQLRPALEVGEQATRAAEQAQARINQLDDERSDLVREFRTIVQRKDAAQLFARQQEKVVESQTREIESLTDQLGRIDEITAVMIPMMLDMIDDLEAFIAADLPFRIEERSERIENLKEVMTRADVVPAEQYRLIIDAYQRELEVGNTIDTWTEEVEIDGRLTDVDVFRYGRVSLVYLSPNSRNAARWDRGTRSWVPLEAQYRGDIRTAIRYAKELIQPVILSAPVQPLTAPRGQPSAPAEALPPEVEEYRSVLLQTDNLGIFADQQELILKSQENEIAALTEQLETAGSRSLEMLPVLIEMVDDLEAFVEADLPFKIEDRRERIASLETAVDRGDLAIGEKYRLIMEAYKDEMAQGSVQETWSDEIDINGQPTEVKLYRYGRVAMVYLSLDRSQAARFDRETRAWVPVSTTMRNDIIKAVKIADGVAQQTVLYAPVTKYSVSSPAQ